MQGYQERQPSYLNAWRAERAIASHKYRQSEMHEVQSQCHPLTFTPEGPGAPKVRRAAEPIQSFKQDRMEVGG